MHRSRLLEDRPLPASAFIPGRFGQRPPEPVLDAARFRAELGDSPDFHYALDLLDAGFPWEAHALLEAMWNAVGRSGESAVMLRVLIKIAAARVKLAQDTPVGARSHLEGARAHLEALTAPRVLGLDVEALRRSLEDSVLGRAVTDDHVERLPPLRFADAWSSTT